MAFHKFKPNPKSFIMGRATEFIKKLQDERTDYKHASQVRTLTNSLLQLSTGIYTEPERFVYELLQNAVDAFADTKNDTLEILIKVEHNKFYFLHNGKPFDEKDVEGVCDVGNGTKSNDKRKIGYKGIGFKSVFMDSVYRVSIKSGDFCFMFDRSKASELMPTFTEGRLAPEDVPWQVIPIEQPELTYFDLNKYNVVTIVESTKASDLADKVQDLFSNLQLLLFLSSKNINIIFERNGNKIFSVGKIMTDTDLSKNTWSVSLLRDGKVQSEWLLHSSEIDVTPEVKKDLKNDFNTPDKLKDAERLEVSFAVQLDKNSVKKVENSTVFTFLPTSYGNLNEPFLINANFITDASRQQLHQGSEWNRLIFKNIPSLYLSFVAEFSKKYSNYVDVLPQRYPAHDSLTECYRTALEESFDDVAFVPNADKSYLLKIKEVLIDEPDIYHSVIPSNHFFGYIETSLKKHFSEKNIVSDTSICSYVHDDYIVKIGWKDLLELLRNGGITDSLTDDDDVELIQFLSTYTSGLKDANNASEFVQDLCHTIFLKNESNGWECPKRLNLPSETSEYNEQAKPECILSSKVYDRIKSNRKILTWLKDDLGIKKLTRINFVKFILEHHDYISPENALEVGNLLFLSWRDDHFLDDEKCCELIQNYPFLSQNGELKPIGTLYLGSKYKPEDDIEPIYNDKSMFISDDYVCNEEVNDWSFFFKKCGAGFKLGISLFEVERSHPLIIQYNFLEEAAHKFRDKDHYYAKWGNIINPIENIKIKLHYFSFIDPEKPKYDLDKHILSVILSRPLPKDHVDKLWGEIHYWTRHRGVPPEEDPLFDYVSNTITNKYHSYLEYIVANVQKFPTTTGTAESPCDIYINSQSNLEIGGKYLPILDINGKMDDSWRELLPFKRELTVQDLLTVLERISEDVDLKKDESSKSVSKIYRELIDRGAENSSELAAWGKTHRVRSTSGDFLPPANLNHITIDGFKSVNKVYCDNVGRETRDKLLQLLKTFGVRVITPSDITPQFDGCVENNIFKVKLENKLQYLASIKSEDNTSFDNCKESLKDKISKSCFFKCQRIILTYGDKDDVIQKQTYAEGGNFYYTGDISAAKIEPMLTPLCKFLGLNNREGELMVILLTDRHNDLLDFLSDKDYDVSCLKEPTIEKENTSHTESEMPHNAPKTEDQTTTEDSIQNAQDREKKESDDENNSSYDEYDSKVDNDSYEEYFYKYSEKVRQFMEDGFSMPKDRILSEHIITRYRCLMYIKHETEYTIKSGFDERKYVRQESYAPIPLAGGQVINVQGAKYGLWHLSPVIWERIVESKQLCCLCVGNRESDFIIIKDEDNLRDIANKKPTTLVRLSKTSNMDIVDTLNSIFSAKKIVLDNGLVLEEGYSKRDVHAMLLIKDTPDEDINSMFDDYQRREHNNFDINWGS